MLSRLLLILFFFSSNCVTLPHQMYHYIALYSVGSNILLENKLIQWIWQYTTLKSNRCLKQNLRFYSNRPIVFRLARNHLTASKGIRYHPTEMYTLVIATDPVSKHKFLEHATKTLNQFIGWVRECFHSMNSLINEINFHFRFTVTLHISFQLAKESTMFQLCKCRGGYLLIPFDGWMNRPNIFNERLSV